MAAQDKNRSGGVYLSVYQIDEMGGFRLPYPNTYWHYALLQAFLIRKSYGPKLNYSLPFQKKYKRT